MSIARHHAEWLSLVEASGPFLSLAVLMRAFPQGLDPHDSEHLQRLRLAYGEWQLSQETSRPDPAIHGEWVKFVLTETLGFPLDLLVSGQKIPEGIKAHFPEHGETLRPDWLVVDPSDSNKPRLLIQVLPSDQDLEKRLAGSRWSASPATRMMELLHSTNIRLGLVTNGHRWMLVNAPKGETTGFISWYSNLWLEDSITLRAFRSLLGIYRFFSVADSQTLEGLLAESAEDQQEVTTQLGYQVRKAVEVLVQKFDRIDKDGSFKLSGISEKRLYEAALAVMMRLVFLFSAEEQGLLLLGEALYDNHYAVSTLRAKLREVADNHGEEVLERRSDAWARLVASFRLVYSGVEHDALQLPAYGGHLFDPDRFAFLEGREEGTSWLETEAQPLAVDNRTVLHLLEALQMLQIKLPGGGSEPRRLSFRALDIEQIGHVYEGLLDHTALRSNAPVLGLEGTKDKEPEVLLAKLIQMQAKGEDALLEFIKEETGRSISTLKKALAVTISPLDTQKFLVVCDHDQALWAQVLPFAGLVRKDTLGYPIVINTGSVYVTQGQDRRSSGTHYTPRSLTEPIVQYTLEPLVYVGPAEGQPKAEWKLKSAAELLKLKVCDFAMGSGAFLVQTCRYLAERLVEAWEEAERGHPGQLVITPEGELSEGEVNESLIPKDPTERMLTAKRVVADRCIYGVDINPMAVEMAKLSLWLVTMQKNRPFTFLDHALKCGDSLLGITDARQIEQFTLNPDEKTTQHLIGEICQPILAQAVAKRKQLEGFAAQDINDIKHKEQLFLEAEVALDRVRFLGDLLIGEALKRISKSEDYAVDELHVLSDEVQEALTDNVDPYLNVKVQALRSKAQRTLGNRKPFHWLLEFPEVFERNGDSGFDAIVGNPPFMGGKKITGALGIDYREFLIEKLARGFRGFKGCVDLCAYFLLRAGQLLQEPGRVGLIATNTISQGDTREIGLDQLIDNGYIIQRAISSCPWPGTASLEVSYLWLHKGYWRNMYILDDQPVLGITPFLTISNRAIGNPHSLMANKQKAFIGSYVLGMGFILTCEEAQGLIDKDPKNKDVLFPYLNGEDLNSRPDQSPSRWVINFFDWPLDWESAPKGYQGQVAANYPDCLAIIRGKVKSERAKLGFKENSTQKGYAKNWWLHAQRAVGLYIAIVGMDRVLVRARVSNINSIAFVPTNIVYSEMIVIFKGQEYTLFSILQSFSHTEWLNMNSSSLRTDVRYTPSDCFETFPFPINIDYLESIGETYYNHRQSIMLNSQQGLTKTYNRFHNPKETATDIEKLRQLHTEMDQAVAAAYGWEDLDLRHGFHETKQGMRYTICEPARREVLDRLLELNHQRYAEEVAAGLHDTGKAKKKGASGKGRKKAKGEANNEVQENLF